MASKKPTAKPAPKKVVPTKAKSAPAKKAAAKKQIVKAPAKKAVAAPKKAATKPVAKAATKKVAPKLPAKKVVSAAKKIAKPVAKKAVAKTVLPKAKVSQAKKSNPKPVAAKKSAPAKTSKTPMPKKVDTKKKETKPAAKVVKTATAKPVKKAAKPAAAKPVVIPKTSTKTARKYQPEFVKSILDVKISDPGAPLTRYNDTDLMEFKELIQRKLESAKKEWNYLQGLITRKDDLGGDESDNRYMTMEDGSLSMEREQLSQMASRQVTFIDHLEKALMRIENKTYGICRVTGKLIDKARLRAVPHATLSIEAKMGIAKG